MKYSFSIVSHNQQDLCKAAIESIIRNVDEDYEILLTLNTNEELVIDLDSNLNFRIIPNTKPLGFGTNHNNAFKHSKGDYFVVVNPDIRINKWSKVNLNSRTLYSPIILNPDGSVADYSRSYPTLINLVKRKFLGLKNEKLDWFAGVFLILESSFFEELNGFDQDFFMYLEDTDLSLRVKETGGMLKVVDSISILHDARRDSKKNLKFFKYHISSLFKFYLKHNTKIIFS